MVFIVVVVDFGFSDYRQPAGLPDVGESGIIVVKLLRACGGCLGARKR